MIPDEITQAHALLDAFGVPPMLNAPGRLLARLQYVLTTREGAINRAGGFMEMYTNARTEWALEAAANAAMEEMES